ncbi:MAG: transcriptional repressor [Bacteroidales bacterium]|nr:transcriptional repressor [Bacteroidales bacterium]
MEREEARNRPVEKKLKVTPQRIAILQVIIDNKSHPTAEGIFDSVRETHPNISFGTVYKVLDTLADNGLIKKVQTEKDIMRYDGVRESHHHLYCTDSDRIEDYFDKDLNEILKSYFEKKSISNFTIEDFKLYITGKFTEGKH